MTEDETGAVALAGFLLATASLGMAVARHDMAAADALRVLDRAQCLADRAGWAQASAVLRQAEAFIAAAGAAARARAH